MSATIFISFASQDRKVALTLCSVLESRGFNCWISARDILPGENFQVSIVQAIRRAKIMLLVFTANSNNSQEMTKELALASQQKLIVVPLRIEDVTPNDAFAYEFATRQWIDFFADWEAAIDQLSRRIANALGQESAPAQGAVAGAPIRLSIAPQAEPGAEAPEGSANRLPRVALEADADEPPASVERASVRRRPKERQSVIAPVAQDMAAQGAGKGRVLALAAAVLVLLIGLGMAAPLLMRNNPAAAPAGGPAVAPIAAAQASTVAPVRGAPAAAAVPAAPTALMQLVEPAGENVTAAAEPAPRRVAKRQAKTTKHAESGLPY